MSLYFSIKQLCSFIIDLSGLSDYCLKKNKQRSIIAYHRVLPIQKANEYMTQNCMWTSPESFEKQIQWMKKVGCIVSLDEIVDKNKSFQKPVFAITFDDGWKDNFDYAFPILKKYNIPATIFLATNAIESGYLFWPEEIRYKTKHTIDKEGFDSIEFFFESYEPTKFKHFRNKDVNLFLDNFIEELKIINQMDREIAIMAYYNAINAESGPVKGQILSWDNIKEMCKSNITFGSHTHSHVILQGTQEQIILNELITSKKIIERQLNKDCSWFCYPNARVNKTDHILLQQAGYKYGVKLDSAQLKKSDSHYYLPRFIIYEDIANPLGYYKLRLLGVPFF